MSFAQTYAITDICILVKDTARSIAFYVDKLGFTLNRQAESFAEFTGAGLTLACWELDHIAAHTGISHAKANGPHKACIAVRLPTAAEIDTTFADLSAKGVVMYGPPKDYVWNARAYYFVGPDDELWEIYAWKDGGSLGNFQSITGPGSDPAKA